MLECQLIQDAYMPFIEDDDTFRQNETLKSEDEEKSQGHGRLFLYLLLAWIVWTAALSAYFLPKVAQAVRESGVISMIEEAKAEEQQPLGERTVAVPYLKGSDFVFYSMETARHGSDKYHDTIEALLNDRPDAALADGAISLIPEGTALRGLTARDGIAYVDLTAELLTGTPINGKSATDEIIAALEEFDEIDKVVLLVDGEVQNL